MRKPRRSIAATSSKACRTAAGSGASVVGLAGRGRLLRAIDVDEFDAIIDRAQQAAAAGKTDDARARYAEAAALYRGDFLEGMQDGSWQWRERERLRASCLEALRWLALERVAAADFRGQRLAYERLLEVAPFDLDAVRARLNALCEEARVAEARRDYEDWRARYRAAVGAEAPDVWSVDAHTATLKPPVSYDPVQAKP